MAWVAFAGNDSSSNLPDFEFTILLMWVSPYTLIQVTFDSQTNIERVCERIRSGRCAWGLLG